MALALDVPVRLGGREVVVVSDEVSSISRFTPSVQVEPSTAKHEFIWCREDDIVAARERHPKLPVYGAWQVALANGWVDFDAPLSIVYTGPHQGLYGVCEDGRLVETGLFQNDAILDSERALPPISKAKVIDGFGETRVSMPREEITTPAERDGARQKARKVFFIGGSAAAAGLACLAIMADLALAHIGNRRAEEIQRIEAQAIAIEADASKALAAASPFTPDIDERFETSLARAAEVIAALEKFQMSNSFAASQWTVFSDRMPAGLTFPMFVSSVPGKQSAFTYSSDGSAPPGPPEEPQ